MPVLFSKHICASTPSQYGSIFFGDEVAKQREQSSTLPAPILSLLAKHGIETPAPGMSFDIAKLDAHLAARDVGVDERFALKGALRQARLI